MLELLIGILNGKLETLNFYDKFHGLAKLVTQANKTTPNVWCGNEWKTVTKFDNFKGSCYWRLTGKVGQTPTESEISCIPEIVLTYPLRLVSFIKRSELTESSGFQEDSIANSIAKVLMAQDSTIAGLLNARSITISSVDYDDRRTVIFNEEYKGIDAFDIKYEYVYLSCDYTIEIKVSQSCLITEC